jgi:signal transduction histidine kinase
VTQSPSLLPTEIDYLYHTSQQLVVASTPAEILEAVSGYARAKGAVTADLWYFDDFQPYWVELVANWSVAEAHRASIGICLDVRNRKLTQVSFANPTRPTFVRDVFDSDIAGVDTQLLATQYQLRALVTLPLYSSGRWIALINFNWKEVNEFNEQDERVYGALQQYAASAVATARLFKQSLDRAVELEIAKREIDILYQFSKQLLASSTPDEVLSAVSGYARDNGAVSGHLFYANETDQGWIELTAEWSLIERQIMEVGWRLPVPDRSLRDGWLSHPEQPTLIADVLTTQTVSDYNRAMLDRFGVRAFVALPLNSKGRWLGVIYFLWDSPHTFDARDERIFMALQSQASPVIDSIRLLEQTRRRAVELEQTNQEMNLLYRASEVINRASSYAEIVDAVAYFDLEADVVTLMLWEHLDWETAAYLDVVVVFDRLGNGVLQSGVRLPKEDFPIAKHMLGQRVWVFEDALTDPRMDSVTAESWAALNIRAFMGPALYVGSRWMGGITFHSSHPRHYSERELRLFAAIGDLVAAAVERVRLQQETIITNQEIELLYRVGESINVANSYQRLVEALLGILSEEILVGLYFWENWDYEKASYVDIAAGTGPLMEHIGQQIPRAALAYTEKLAHDAMMVIEDVETDPRLDPETVSRYLKRGLRAVISIRLYVHDRWIGALTFQSSTPRQFTVQERRLAAGVGEYVRGAVERIRLQQETEAARRAAEQFAAQAQQLAALEERTRLARELHDSVSQVLYSISLWGHSAHAYLKHDPSRIGESVNHILSLAEVGLSEMRTLIFELRPESLEEEGLISALAKQADSIRARHGIDVTTEFCAEPPLPLQVKSDIYRIAREALHNAIKHAQATHLTLCFCEIPSGYILEIRDNGYGFDTSQSFPGHLGLKSMRERAVSLNGTFQIESKVGAGTHITLTILS